MSAADACFKKNLELLGARAPALVRRVLDVEGEPDEFEVRVIDSRQTDPATGRPWPSLEVRAGAGGPWLRLHSAHDPVTEAARRVAAMHDNATHSWLVCGFGLGYHVEAIKQQLAHEAFTLIVVEASLAIFRAALRVRDFSALLVAFDPLKRRTEPEGRVHLFVGAQLPRFSEWLFQTLGEVVVQEVTVHKHGPSERLFGPFYNQAVVEVGQAVNRFEVNVLTAQEHGRRFLSNMLQNGVAALDAGDPGRVRGAFAGRPVFCVAAGPSLDRNVHLLRQAQGRAVVVAVDSAYPTLARAGVEPDVLATIDPIPRKARILARVRDPARTFLLAIQHCHPELIAAFPGRCLLSFTNAPVAQWLARLVGDFAFLGECLTVAHGAFYFARHLGGDPIVFVGQDLAFPPDFSAGHASADEGAGSDASFDRDVTHVEWVPGIFGTPVPTYKNLQAFITTFGTEIDRTAARVIDATEGGAYIPGTRVAMLREVLAEFCTEPFPITEVLAAAAEPAAPPGAARALADAAGRFRTLSDRLIRTCVEGQRIAADLERMVRRDDFVEQMRRDRKFAERYQRAAQRLQEANREAFREPEFIDVVVQSTIRTRIDVKHHDDAIKYARDDLSRQRRQAEKFLGVFRDFERAGTFFRDELDKVLRRLAPRGAAGREQA